MVERRKFVGAAVAAIVVVMSLVVLGSASWAQEKTAEKVIKIRVIGDPDHGADKPCDKCMQAVLKKCQKIKGVSSVKTEGDVVIISGNVKAEDVVKAINNLGFKTEIIEGEK